MKLPKFLKIAIEPTPTAFVARWLWIIKFAVVIRGPVHGWSNLKDADILIPSRWIK